MIVPSPGRHHPVVHAGWQRDRRWWGRSKAPDFTPSLGDLVVGGMVSPEVAQVLRGLIARRTPLTVISRDSRVGKTTLLTALLSELPPPVVPVVLRGCYEPFDFVGDPARLPAETALLINEISPHWPFYLWGPAVAKALRLNRRGYALYSTAHAESPAELIAMLAQEPLRVPMRDIASLGMIVVLDALTDPTDPTGMQRGVRSCHGLAMAADGRGIEQFDVARTGQAGETVLCPAEWMAWEERSRFRLPDQGGATVSSDASVAHRSVPACRKE